MIQFLYRLFGFGAEENPSLLSRKEALVLDLLDKEEGEMFGKEIVEASNGVISLRSSYVLFAHMENKGLLAARKIKKIIVDEHDWMGEMVEWRHFVWKRLYRRGVPQAKALKPSGKARRDKARLLSDGG